MAVSRSIPAVLPALGLLGIGYGQGQTPQEVLRLYRIACSAVPSYRVEYTVTTTANPETTKQAEKPYTARYREYCSGPKHRLDVLKRGSAQYRAGMMTSMSDGVRGIDFDGENRQGSVQPWAARPSNDFCLANSYKSILLGLDYATLLEERELVVRSQSGRVILSSTDRGAFTARFGRGSSLSLYLDPEKGMMPVQVDEYVCYPAGGRFLFYRYMNELMEVSPGAWLPVGSERRHFHADSKTPFATDFLELDLARCSFVAEIADSTFTMSFPMGTRVRDEINGDEVVIGAENKQQYLDRLARQGRLGVEQLRKTWPHLYHLKAENGHWRTYLLWTSVSSLPVLAAAFLLIYRRRRSAKITTGT